MGVFEEIFRPGNEERERTVRGLITDIIADLKYITNASNKTIDTFNKILGEKVEKVVFEEKTPEKLVADVRARFLEIERLAKMKYDKIEAGVDKPTLDTVVEKFKGRTTADIDKIVEEFKVYGMSANTAGIAAASVVVATLTPLLLKSLSGLASTVLGGFLGAAAGIIVTAIIDAIAAEQKYRKLEEAIKDLTETRNLLNKNREAVVSATDDLMMAVRIAEKEAGKSG